MDIKESIRMAGVDIRLNKTRSLLSMLGIIIGIASVIIIVAIGNGLKYKVMSQFAGFGANRIYISAGWDPDTRRMGEISMSDIASLQSLHGVVNIAPQINWNAEIKGVNKSINMDIRGVTEDYFGIAGMELDQGRLLSATDMEYRQKDR